ILYPVINGEYYSFFEIKPKLLVVTCQLASILACPHRDRLVVVLSYTSILLSTKIFYIFRY
ncbi:MAG: hypothetical protein WCF97_07400, partial [Nitrososphaeraceae archaeon]